MSEEFGSWSQTFSSSLPQTAILAYVKQDRFRECLMNSTWQYLRSLHIKAVEGQFGELCISCFSASQLPGREYYLFFQALSRNLPGFWRARFMSCSTHSTLSDGWLLHGLNLIWNGSLVSSPTNQRKGEQGSSSRTNPASLPTCTHIKSHDKNWVHADMGSQS